MRGKIPVVFGNALHSDIIKVSNIHQASTIIALTDNDLTNLNILLNAKELNPNIKTIGRIFNHQIREKARDAFEIDSVYSTSHISAPAFVSSAAHSKTIYAFNRNKEIYSLIEINVEKYGFLKSMKQKQVLDQYGLFPLFYRSGAGESGFISHEYSLKEDDRVILFGQYEKIKRFPDL